MSKKPVVNPDQLFAEIGNPTTLTTAQDGADAAVMAEKAATSKALAVTNALDEQQAAISEASGLISQRIGAVKHDHLVFDLQVVVEGWFTPDEIRDAAIQVEARNKTRLNLESAASYGTVPDGVVQQFVNSAATKASGQARLAVANVLDRATGITKQIAEDKNIASDEIAKKAKRLIEVWQNVRMLNALYGRLFTQTLNRVVDYQDRLGGVGQDLAKKRVTLESISSSLVARQALVKSCLYDTCIAGLALAAILDRAYEVLEDLNKEKEAHSDTPQAYTQKVQEQEALIEIIIKRLVDLKAFSIKLIGLYSVLGNTRLNVAIIKADVEFTRTNLMATLGLQLGLVLDIIATLRISRAACNLRQAEADAAEQVGVATDELNEAGNQALTDVETTIRSLKATVTAAVTGIENTHANMQRVETMSTNADKEFAALFATMNV